MPGVAVTSILPRENNDHHDIGESFFFDKAQWQSAFGTAPGGTFTVVQLCGGTEIWQGTVVTWDSTDGVYGSRESGSWRGQWQVGDVISPAGIGQSIAALHRPPTAHPPTHPGPCECRHAHTYRHSTGRLLSGSTWNSTKYLLKAVSAGTWHRSTNLFSIADEGKTIEIKDGKIKVDGIYHDVIWRTSRIQGNGLRVYGRQEECSAGLGDPKGRRAAGRSLRRRCRTCTT